jgi:pantothenate kinase
MVRQRDMHGLVSTSYGFAYGGTVVVSAKIHAQTYLLLNLDGGAEIFRLNGQRTHRATGSALMGGAVAF